MALVSILTALAVASMSDSTLIERFATRYHDCDVPGAAAILDASSEPAPEPDATIARALLDAHAGEYDRARDALEPVVDTRPDDLEARLTLILVYGELTRRARFYATPGRAKRWYRFIDDTLTRFPDDLRVRNWSIQYLVNAPGIGGGDKEKALAQAQEAVAIDSLEGHLLVGLVQDRRDDHDAARAAFIAAAGVDSTSALPWVGLARLSLEEDDLDVARRHLEEASARWPDEHAVLVEWGSYHLARNEQGSAITAFERALADWPCDGDLRWRLAELLEEVGDAERARHHYRTLARAFPGHHRATDARDRME